MYDESSHDHLVNLLRSLIRTQDKTNKILEQIYDELTVVETAILSISEKIDQVNFE